MFFFDRLSDDYPELRKLVSKRQDRVATVIARVFDMPESEWQKEAIEKYNKSVLDAWESVVNSGRLAVGVESIAHFMGSELSRVADVYASISADKANPERAQKIVSSYTRRALGRLWVREEMLAAKYPENGTIGLSLPWDVSFEENERRLAEFETRAAPGIITAVGFRAVSFEQAAIAESAAEPSELNLLAA